MDTFQYTNSGVIHRNKIRTNTGSIYLTIPIAKQFRTAVIKDVELPLDKQWKEIHWKTIYYNYIRTDFFKRHADFFEEFYKKDFHYLWQMNTEIIRYLLKSFDINVEIVTASSLGLGQYLKHTDMIISVLDALDAKTYLSGPSGRKYLESEKMEQYGFNLKFAKFNCPIYKQRYPGFVANLASIDLLFNMGPQSKEIIRSSGTIDD
jgi:hypothetical protein